MTKNYKVIKGFTIIELLVVLVLSSLAISLGYRLLVYSQKLFLKNKSQNQFLRQQIFVKSTLIKESHDCKFILEEKNNEFLFKSDSTHSYLMLNNEFAVLKKGTRVDTIKVLIKNISKVYEPFNNIQFKNKLLREISFNLFYSESYFPIQVTKNYTSFDKISLENL